LNFSIEFVHDVDCFGLCEDENRETVAKTVDVVHLGRKRKEDELPTGTLFQAGRNHHLVKMDYFKFGCMRHENTETNHLKLDVDCHHLDHPAGIQSVRPATDCNDSTSR
jgi:hypothetical protein